MFGKAVLPEKSFPFQRKEKVENFQFSYNVT